MGGFSEKGSCCEAEALDDAARADIDEQGNREQHEADRKERAVVDGAGRHLAHFLRNDARHGMRWLRDYPDTEAEIWNRDLVSGYEKNHHRFTDYAAKSEQDCGKNIRK